MTLLARNEEDILDAHLSFHRAAGVDFVLAIDNGSDDSTTDILGSYARDGFVDVTRETGDLKQAEWVTRLARRAATEFGADWVINSDADEFYWPRGGSLKDVLRGGPGPLSEACGACGATSPRDRTSDEFFAERMTFGSAIQAPRTTAPTVRASRRRTVVHPEVTVLPGNHIERSAAGSTRSPGWYPIDVLHFPIRSLEHFTEKYLRWWALAPSLPRSGVRRPSGRSDARVLRVVRGRRRGARAVASPTGRSPSTLGFATRCVRSAPAGSLTFADGEVDAAYLSELSALAEADPDVLAHQRAADLDVRLAALEQRRSARFLRAVTARVRGVA